MSQRVLMHWEMTMLGRIFPWLARTRQLWKMRISLALASATCACLMGVIYSVNTQDRGGWGVLYGLACTGIGSLFFLWLSFAVRCPFCGLPIVFQIMRTVSERDFWAVLTTVEKCSRCERSL